MSCATITPVVTRHDWLFTWNMIREGVDIVHEHDDPLLYGSALSISTPCTVVIMLSSSSNDFNQRQAIRLTWGRQARYYGMRVLFVISLQSTARWLDMALESEMSLHNDVLLIEKNQENPRSQEKQQNQETPEIVEIKDETTSDIHNAFLALTTEEADAEASDDFSQCAYFAMFSMDTYVRPYQLLAMLDQIETGDDAAASHAASLLHEKKQEMQRAESVSSASSSSSISSLASAKATNTGSSGCKSGSKSGSCNCDWATKEVCNHENANDGSLCFFECCCPNVPALKQLVGDDEKHEDSEEVEDDEATTDSTTLNRYTYVQGDPPRKTSRLEMPKGIGRNKISNGGEDALYVYVGGHTHTLVEENMKKMTEEDGTENSAEKESWNEHVSENMYFIMSMPLTRQMSRCFVGEEGHQQQQQQQQQQQTDSQIMAKCLHAKNEALIVKAEPMHQTLPCNVRTAMTTSMVETRGQHFTLPLLHTDWNLFVLHDAHVRRRYCITLNGNREDSESIRALHRRIATNPHPLSSQHSSTPSPSHPSMVTLPLFDSWALQSSMTKRRNYAPWENIDPMLGPSTYIFSVGVDATRDYGWAAKNAHRDSGQRQIKERWKRHSASGSSIIVSKCVNCQGAWYSTIYGMKQQLRSKKKNEKKSKVPSVMIPTHSLSVVLPGNNIINIGHERKIRKKFDVALPFACEWKRLLLFLKRFPLFPRNDIDVRLLLTNYHCPDGTSKSKDQLVEDISRQVKLSIENIIIVDVHDDVFSRAAACNALHRHARENAILLVTDVDMEVKYSFFLHAEMFVQAGISAYFPIVWSKFSPASIRLVEKFRGARVGLLSDYEGMWRPFGYGMYAIHGSDALELLMNEQIVGWGGEDNDFHKRCSAVRHIVRMHEPNLVHLWHDKDCSVVDSNRRKACVGSLASVEGSGLALYLQMHRIKRECDSRTKQ